MEPKRIQPPAPPRLPKQTTTPIHEAHSQTRGDLEALAGRNLERRIRSSTTLTARKACFRFSLQSFSVLPHRTSSRSQSRQQNHDSAFSCWTLCKVGEKFAGSFMGSGHGMVWVLLLRGWLFPSWTRRGAAVALCTLLLLRC